MESLSNWARGHPAGSITFHTLSLTLLLQSSETTVQTAADGSRNADVSGSTSGLFLENKPTG